MIGKRTQRNKSASPTCARDVHVHIRSFEASCCAPFRVFVHVGISIKKSQFFFNVKTDAISEPIPTFTVGFDGNMDKGSFHSIRFDEKSFTIPDEVSSDQDQLGRFFVYHQTIEDGSKVCHLYKLGNTKTQITLKRFG